MDKADQLSHAMDEGRVKPVKGKMPKGVKVGFPIVYPHEVIIKVEWPHELAWDGRTFHKTRFEHRDLKTDRPAQEYVYDDGNEYKRVFLNVDGTVVRD